MNKARSGIHCIRRLCADVAQLVARRLVMVKVAGSIRVVRASLEANLIVLGRAPAVRLHVAFAFRARVYEVGECGRCRGLRRPTPNAATIAASHAVPSRYPASTSLR